MEKAEKKEELKRKAKELADLKRQASGAKMRVRGRISVKFRR